MVSAIINSPILLSGFADKFMAQRIPSPTPQESLRILIVDDLEDAAESLALLLRMHGYNTRATYSGESAFRLAREFLPQVALLDLALPGIDGYQLAARLRREAQMQSACLIAISGYGRDTDLLQAQEAGFDHHLLKPVQIVQLLPMLARVALTLKESVG
jgi:CheY-like chemotaxis protein